MTRVERISRSLPQVHKQREREPAKDLFESLLMQVPTSISAYICPECAGHSHLSEIVRRVVELSLKAVPNKDAS